MEVILKKDVKGTGKEGDIVKVSDGFARNKLIPGGLAVEATEANKRAIAREKAKAAEKFALDSNSAVGKIKQASQGWFSVNDAEEGMEQRKRKPYMA